MNAEKSRHLANSLALAAAPLYSFVLVAPAQAANRISVREAIFIGVGFWGLASVLLLAAIHVAYALERIEDASLVSAIRKAIFGSGWLAGICLGIIGTLQAAFAFGPPEKLGPICRGLFTVGGYHFSAAVLLVLCWTTISAVRYGLRKARRGLVIA